MGQLTNLYVSESYQGLIKLTDSTTGVTGNLQYLQDGLGNRLPIQMSTSSVSITGSLFGTASYATQALSASWAPDNIDSGSYVTTSSFNAFTASIDGRVDALELETGSLQSQINQKLNTSSFNSYTSSNDSKVNSLIASTGSYATTSSLTALSQSIATTDLGQNNVIAGLATTSSLTSLSSSIASTDLGQNNRLTSIEQKTGSFATTGSNIFQGNQTISGSLFVTGSITALSASITYLQTVYQTSSVVFSSGSNILGDEAADTQTLWGRVAIPTGPVSVTGSVIATNFTGSLQGTASYATNALSSSYSNNSTSASFAQNALSASYAPDTTNTGSLVTSVLATPLVGDSITVTKGDGTTNVVQITNVNSASFANNATSSSFAQNATSSSFSQNTISGSFSNFAVSSSYAQTASFASNGGVTQILAGPNIIVSPLSGQGQVTISSTGTGTGSFNTATGSYGSFYDTTTQTNPVANTPRSMSFNETTITNGVSISGSISPFNTYIKTENAGVYNIQFSAQIDKTDLGTDEMYIWLSKNGNDLLDSAGKVTLASSSDADIVSWNWFVQSATNDYYQIKWSSPDTGMRILAEPSSSTHPGIPSIIATANRVDQFLSNTGSFTGSFIGSFTGSLEGTASFATNALSASYAPGVSIPAGTVSGSAQIIELGFATTSSVNQKLDTGSFNTYTASMDARTGSYITTGSISTSQAITGSLIMTGSVDVTGSLNVRNGNLELISNNTTLNIDSYLTSSQAGQSNMIFGWSDNPGSSALSTQANYTGSLRITGSNNIVSIPQIRGTNFQSSWSGYGGYISGSNNWFNGYGGIYLATGSQLLPKTQGNIIGFGAAIGLGFTSSSLSSPTIQANTILSGQMNIVHNSGSLTAAGNLLNTGQISSTQAFATNVVPSLTANMMLGGTIVLNHVSSSIIVNQNFVATPLTVNNHVSSSNITNNSVTLNNNMWLGGSNSTGPGLWVSGSQSSNVTRAISDNLFGGRSLIISSSHVSSSNSNLFATIMYGSNLNVSASHTTANTGGSAFFGRFNDTGSLSLSQDIVFAVGTGTAAATRRTGFYITSGSLVGVSGSLQVIGDGVFTGSLTLSGSANPELTVIGNTILTGSVQGNVLPLTVASNTASLDLNNGNFFELALTGSQNIFINPSNIKPGQTVNIKLNTTGSGTVTFPTSVKQPSGSAYTPTTSVGTDIITMVSFDSTNLFVANVKNLI